MKHAECNRWLENKHDKNVESQPYKKCEAVKMTVGNIIFGLFITT